MAQTSETAETRYKIGDVCRIADVQPYVLRYWESEFPVLAADRSIPGPRTYSARELALIGQIKRLLYDEGYTIAGAKKRLESEGAGAKAHETNPAVTPLDAEEGDKAERSERGGRVSEKVPVRTRPPSKPGVPMFVETSPAASPTAQVATAPAVEPAKPADVVAPPASPLPDPRIQTAVTELKEILAILSRE